MISVAPQREQNETINQLCDTEPRWFAVYTRYKREKLVLKELQRRGINAYLPLQTVTRYYTRKVKTVHLPLISCYIFVFEDIYIHVSQSIWSYVNILCVFLLWRAADSGE